MSEILSNNSDLLKQVTEGDDVTLNPETNQVLSINGVSMDDIRRLVFSEVKKLMPEDQSLRQFQLANGNTVEISTQPVIIMIQEFLSRGTISIGIAAQESEPFNARGGEVYSDHRPLSPEMAKLTAESFSKWPNEDGYYKGIQWAVKILVDLLEQQNS